MHRCAPVRVYGRVILLDVSLPFGDILQLLKVRLSVKLVFI